MNNAYIRLHPLRTKGITINKQGKLVFEDTSGHMH